MLPFPPCMICRLAGASVIPKSGGAVTVTVNGTVAIRLPEVPLIINWDIIAAAELATVSVNVLFAVVLAGLNEAVTPAGKPVAVKATVPLNPVCGATVMVAVPVPPTPTVKLVTEELSLKPGIAATVKAMAVCAERAPDVPVMVRVAGPTTAEAAAESFSEVPVNAAVTPVGNPLMVSTGVPVKPLSAVTVIVLVPDEPCVTLKLAGAAPRVKLDPAFTVKLNVAVAKDVPEVPVTVTVLVPGVAPDAALKVATLVVAVVAGLNETVTPVGRVEVVSVTLPVKPFLGVTVIVLVARGSLYDAQRRRRGG